MRQIIDKYFEDPKKDLSNTHNPEFNPSKQTIIPLIKPSKPFFKSIKSRKKQLI